MRGALEEEFQRQYPSLIENLKHGEKASLTINLEIKRVPDTTTMMSLGYKIATKAPARSNATVAQVFGDGRLKVEKPAPKVEQLRVLGGSGSGHGGSGQGSQARGAVSGE
jgi:hypothetical protein